jgi:hypothetical protein
MGGKMKYGLLEIWWYEIDTPEKAKRIVRDTAKGLFTIAVVMVLASFILGGFVLLDSAILVALGLWLLWRQDRPPATVALLYASYTFVMTAINWWGYVSSTGGGSGRNIVLAIIVLWASIRSVQATYKFSRLREVVVPRVAD